ncbi:MAG: type II toxin-antitoxin system YafQ family toxin [Legionella sp.]|nr:type II toxin-antitoxin system YafQ family toxin [Legionella sp.]
MVLRSITTKQFEKDVKLAIKRDKKMQKLQVIMQLLLQQKALPLKNRDHCLTGNYVSRRECHVEPDWLLIYKREADIIIFERTGTHADLFK